MREIEVIVHVSRGLRATMQAVPLRGVVGSALASIFSRVRPS